jgi:hypothetical protein
LPGHTESDKIKPGSKEALLAGHLIVVRAAFDADAGVWFVESSDIPGLNAEAPSIEALVALLPAMVADLAEESDVLSDFDNPTGEFSIEVLAHASARLHLGAAA